MRKQYHHRRVGADWHIWDVHRLVRASRDFPVCEVALSCIGELDEDWWYQEEAAVPSPRSIAKHMAQVQEADLSFPIILCSEGRVMDGMHRVVKALMMGNDHILAVRFEETPPPDFINVALADLPYPDEEV